MNISNVFRGIQRGVENFVGKVSDQFKGKEVSAEMKKSVIHTHINPSEVSAKKEELQEKLDLKNFEARMIMGDRSAVQKEISSLEKQLKELDQIQSLNKSFDKNLPKAEVSKEKKLTQAQYRALDKQHADLREQVKEKVAKEHNIKYGGDYTSMKYNK